MTPIQSAEAMREAAAQKVGEVFNYETVTGREIAAAIRAIPIPTEAASEPFTSEPFKATRIDMDSSGVTVWAFEDCATVARDAFPGVHHFIDELRAMEDGRLVGVQFWGPPPVAPLPTEAEELPSCERMDCRNYMCCCHPGECKAGSIDQADDVRGAVTEAAEPGELEKELATFKAVVRGSRECADYWLAQCAALRAELARMKSALEIARKQIETWRDETKAAMETVTGESWVWHDGRATSLSDVLTIIAAALQEPANANG